MHLEERVVITDWVAMTFSPNLRSKKRHSHLQDAHYSFIL